jgi:hypothetical protein
MFSRDGKRVVVNEPNGMISLREYPSLRVIGPSHPVGKPLGFLPDATAFVSIRWPADTGAAEVDWWRVPDFALLRRTALAQAVSAETTCQLSPDGHWLATGGVNNEVRVFDLEDHGRLAARTSESEQDDGYAIVLAFSPDSRRVAACFSRSSPVYLWNWASPSGLFALKGHGTTVLGLAFSPDGQTLFSGDGTIKLWDVASRKEVATFPNLAQLSVLSGLALSPDGKTLATTRDREVQLWNVVTRREVSRFQGTAAVSSVAFTPDGRALFITEQRANGPVTLVKHAPSFAETDQNH